MTPAKPIRSFRLLPGGRCGCTACLNDEQRDQQKRDAALAAIAHDLAKHDDAPAANAGGVVAEQEEAYLVHP